MATKTYNIDGIGEITVYKRRGTRKLSMRYVGGKLRVTQPPWLPYASGVQFAKTNISWVLQNRTDQSVTLRDGMNIGKAHTLSFEPGKTLRTRITESEILVYIPPNLTPKSPEVEKLCISAIKRTLKKQAELHLPDRLAYCARTYGFKYKSVYCKSMRSRWGSCNNKNEITLNIFLMMVPWELIDYVLVHELVHTEHLHHGPIFWERVAEVLPDYKQRRKKLRELQTSISPLQ